MIHILTKERARAYGSAPNAARVIYVVIVHMDRPSTLKRSGNCPNHSGESSESFSLFACWHTLIFVYEIPIEAHWRTRFLGPSPCQIKETL